MTEPRSDVAAMLRAGATYRQIMTTLGVGPETIAATRKTLGIPVPVGRGGGRKPREPRADIAALLRDGATEREVVAKLGVSSRTIQRARMHFGIPRPQGPGRRLSAEERQACEQLLRQGAPYRDISARLHISRPTIWRIRTNAGIPLPHRQAARTRAEALALHTEPYGDGHQRWNGGWAGRMPQMCAENQKLNARHVAFQLHHQRPHDGYVMPGCGEAQCIAGAHLTDHTLRTHPTTPGKIR